MLDFNHDDLYMYLYVHVYIFTWIITFYIQVHTEGTAGPDITSPMTPVGPINLIGEKMELWLFYSEQPPDLQVLLSPQLKRKSILYVCN